MCIEIWMTCFCVHTVMVRSIQELRMFPVVLRQVTHLRKIAYWVPEAHFYCV